MTNQEGRRARFYESYRKVAEEYDKEFLKGYNEDLDTTLIFVSFSSMISYEHALTGIRLVCSLLLLPHS